ncbi:hypothetical protein [Flavobacterium selenitireducens]|uniref:hypothetical protein n=1 Tax=Flavobacterium selenitireducens TaxID=2722704 RepID=UPI00168B6E25|nr:hypothetical protein [Flavobacterium selenitireducens]MBD3581190.1 hypothetical protein [Flavobacterium selenitireducens]
MKFFLRLKHWQLFLIAFAIPFCVYIGIFVCSFVLYQDPTLLLQLFPLILVLSLFGQYGWIFSVGKLLNAQLPNDAGLKLGHFYFFFFFPLVYIFVFALGVGSVFSASPEMMEPHLLPFLLLVVLPIHFFAIFCMFYCLYFVSKTIRSVELGKEAVLSDYIGEFFMIWFFPFGLWLLQPRLNKLISQNGNIEQTTIV